MALPSAEFVIGEVDREFALQHPEAPAQLDPNDPSQAELVQAWNEMYRDFLNRTVDSHFFRFFPNAPERLDPNNPDDAQLIEYWNDIRDAIEDRPHKWDWSNEPSTVDSSAQTPTTGEPAPGGDSQPSDPGTAPQVGVKMDENAFKEWVRLSLEGAHRVGDTAEVLGYLAEAAGAGEDAGLVLFGEALGPVGMVASTIIVLWATARAFGTGLRLQEQEGFCYGVMWEACGFANQEKGFTDWSDDTAEELSTSFYEGVASGREKGAETTVHNRVMLATAYYQKAGNDLTTAQSKVLDDMWLKIRESDKTGDTLGWPQPFSIAPGGI
jgi:hypothetical protein